MLPRNTRPRPRRSRGLLLAVGALLLAATARAGGSSPETTILIVNVRSPDSLAIANAWVRLRGIPTANVVFLDDVPDDPVIPIEAFRTRIWAPIAAWMHSNGMYDRADLVVYSAGFPYGIDFTTDVRAADFQVRPPISKTASLTAMTYFARHVEAREPAQYLDLRANRYFRRPDAGRTPPRGPTSAEAAIQRQAVGAMQAKDHEKARTLLEQLLESWPENANAHYNHACCLALLDRTDDALRELRSAVDHGYGNASHAESDSDLASLRAEPEFDEILERARNRVVTWQPTHGFRSRLAWTGSEDPVTGDADDSADRYWLSAMLGYTGPNGSSREDVLAYLETAASVDGTRPAGTFYFLANDNVRSNTREPLFPTAVAALREMGLAAEVLTKGRDGQDGVLPHDKPDVLGVVAGVAGFDWNRSGSTLVPGAIAEHLTSFGAHFGTKGQTKCVRFLEAGAAGTCGTVAEPYAVQHKFPVPHVHVHYARGVSMAEAIYQSVSGPYQLLVLGDPLARPFARFAEVELAAPSTRRAWKGVVEVEADVAGPQPIASIELWIDGRYVGEAPPCVPIAWDTTEAGDGVHQLRLIAVEDSRIATRSTTEAEIKVRNHRLTVRSTAPRKPLPLDGSISVSGRATGCEVVELRCGTRVLARAEGVRRSWKLELSGADLGPGQVTLHARGLAADGREVLGEPFEVNVVSPR